MQELEAEQQQVQEEKELLSRQKDAMRAEAGPVEQRMYSSQSFCDICLYFLKNNKWSWQRLLPIASVIISKNVIGPIVIFSHLLPNVSMITFLDF